MTSGTMTGERRAALIREHDALLKEYVEGAANDTLEYDEERALYRATEALLEEYFTSLPRPVLGRCPFCQAPYRHSFDPWGFDGYWWQEQSAKTTVEPEPCPHFGVLQGAVNLKGKPPMGGREEASLGPGLPFVIPRVLEPASVVAVLHQVPMAEGHIAYPITYFTHEPLPPGSFTQRWTRSSYSWRDANGGFLWRVDTDPWDFDLGPWLERRKIYWIEKGDSEMRLHSQKDGPCPYVGLEGTQERQLLQGDQLWTAEPPAGEGVDPFGE